MSVHASTPVDVLAAVRTHERRILAAEGPYHVEGRYYANPDDAGQQRRLTAERLVREATRRAAWTARTAALAPLPRPRVSTWLTPRERAQVDAAASDRLAFTHRDGLAAIGCALAAGDTDAVLISAALVGAADLPLLTQLARHLPSVASAGLVTDGVGESQALAAAHVLGQAGVGALLDCRSSTGWDALRGTFAPRHLPDAFLRACVASVLADLRDETGAHTDGPADGLVQFFAAAFAPDVMRAGQVAARLGVLPSTLACRFFRAGLPSPKRYVTLARLVWAARLGESPGLSLSTIAARLDASSPQSFCRTVRLLTGRSAAEFRRTTTGREMLDQYRATLVTPYRDTLRTFDPTAADFTERRAFLVRGVDACVRPQHTDGNTVHPVHREAA